MQHATAKRLREERMGVVKAMRALTDRAEAEKRDLGADENAKYLELNAAYDAYVGTPEKPGPLARAERLDALEASLAEADPRTRLVGRDDYDGRNPRGGDGATAAAAEEQRGLALQAWMRSQMGYALSERHQEACRAVGLAPQQKVLRVAPYGTEDLRRLRRSYRQGHASTALGRVQDFKATMSGLTGPTGGYVTPPETLTRELEVNLLAFGGMRQVAETITTETGERLSWPTADDTTNVGVQLGESGAAMPPGQASVDPPFAKVYWDAYKFSSQPVLVPYELLQDAVFPLVKLLGEMLGVRLGRKTNRSYTNGTGAGQPKGLVTAATAFAATSSTAIFFDDFFGLVHSIDPAYRTADCGFMCHDNVVLAVRKLKDGQGRYLWEPGLAVGAPDRILGYEWTVNQDMDSTFASGKNTVLFGQLDKYKIRRVGEMRLYHLEERYRDTDQDGFVALIREDGNLLTAGTPPVKVLHHA